MDSDFRISVLRIRILAFPFIALSLWESELIFLSPVYLSLKGTMIVTILVFGKLKLEIVQYLEYRNQWMMMSTTYSVIKCLGRIISRVLVMFDVPYFQ